MKTNSPMILLDKPYISNLLLDTIRDLEVAAYWCNVDEDELPRAENIASFVSKDQLGSKLRQSDLVYLNSENAISYVLDYSPNSELAKKTALLKNKLTFRQMTKSLYPNIFFKGIKSDELANLREQDLIFPFILKPAIGFFSMNVYKINNFNEYQHVLKNIGSKIEMAELLYPKHVIDTSQFIIEQYLDGEEFAIDAYYNSEGKPVILNILKHLFASKEDTSDRVYYTHRTIIHQYMNVFTEELEKLGALFDLRSFPVHVEYRVLGNGKAVPIEVNPLRFGGWGLCELVKAAFDINPYEYFLKQKEPCWDEIFKEKKDKYYSFNIADIPDHLFSKGITEVDYEKFSTLFGKALEIRKVDYNKYPVFALVFAEMEHFDELLRFLNADLSKYLILEPVLR